MGKPERYQYRNNFYEINLAKVPMTEECKLLPAPGIYAISSKTDNSDSKGMVIINETSDGEKEVLLNFFDGDPNKYNRDSIIFFHKRIHGSLNLSDQSDSARWLKAAKTEIAELIY
jgi:hypothetical protein